MPRKLVLQFWPARAEGRLGAAATRGYVAFNTARINATGPYLAAYTIVTSLDGSDVRITPSFRASDGERLHMCGAPERTARGPGLRTSRI